ncbi:MAG: TfoX/Sxy family DNA transformation protein, partial [Burkholderiales bacterium]
MPLPNTILKGLTNIGPTIAARLEAVGVRTVGDLRRIGPARVFQRV